MVSNNSDDVVTQAVIEHAFSRRYIRYMDVIGHDDIEDFQPPSIRSPLLRQALDNSLGVPNPCTKAETRSKDY